MFVIGVYILYILMIVTECICMLCLCCTLCVALSVFFHQIHVWTSFDLLWQKLEEKFYILLFWSSLREHEKKARGNNNGVSQIPSREENELKQE